MKKQFFTAVAIIVTGLAVNAQVGIGTTTPNTDASLQVTSPGANKGLLLPTVLLTSTSSATPMTAHVAGMLVYNTATTGDVVPGLYVNDGAKWGNISVIGSISPTSGGTAVVSAIDCSGALTGTLTEQVAASGVTKIVTATVATVGTYAFTTSTLNGITWSASGTFAGTGSQNITLTASGTPTVATTSSFSISTTPSCSFSATAIPAPDEIRDALSASQADYIAAPTNSWVAVTQSEYNAVAGITGAGKVGFIESEMSTAFFGQTGNTTTIIVPTVPTYGAQLPGTHYVVALSFVPWNTSASGNGFKMKYAPNSTPTSGLVDYPNNTTFTNINASYTATVRVFYVLKKPTVQLPAGSFVFGGFQQTNLTLGGRGGHGTRNNGGLDVYGGNNSTDTNPILIQAISTGTKSW